MDQPENKTPATITVGGRIYTLAYDANALCDLEDEAKMSITDFGKSLTPEQVSMKSLRLLLWAGLRRHHRDVDVRGAGDLLSQVDIAVVAPVLGAAFVGALNAG